MTASDIVAHPPPLNPHSRFPYRVDVFQADTILNFGGLAPAANYEPQPAEDNPERFAD